MAFTDIDNPELYMQCKIYTGNATDDTAITLDGDENMQPDLVWIKDRTNGNHHRIYDSVRGATKVIYSSLTNAEGTASTGLKSFDSDGFTLGTGSDENGSGAAIVAWCWKESATAGFDIVTYTGNATSGNTVSHSLSAVPEFITTKRTNGGDGGQWNCYHVGTDSSAPEDKYVLLNSTSAVLDSATRWNDTAPTSSIFTLGSSGDLNDNSNAHVAYLWRSVQGYSKIGSYTGNGNADGIYLHLGFRPAFFICKRYNDSGYDWLMYDNKRQVSFNVIDDFLKPNLADAETTGNANQSLDFLSNGVKFRGNGASSNGSGASYIFMAFAEAPFVNSNGVPCNAR